MADENRVFDADNFSEHVETQDGYFASLYVAAGQVARTAAEASDQGWELLAVTPYHLRNGVTESEVEAYMVLLWREK